MLRTPDDLKDKPRKRGSSTNGTLERRGKSAIWGYRFKYDGIEYRRSTGTEDRTEAEIILRKRMTQLVNMASEGRMEILRECLMEELATDIRASTIGAAGEKLVCVDLMNRGFAVFEAASANSPCDLVAIMGDVCIRIEVKVGSITKSGRLDYNTIRPTCSYDALAIITRRDGIFYQPSLESLMPTQNSAKQPECADIYDGQGGQNVN